jgi:hypothetical protein
MSILEVAKASTAERRLDRPLERGEDAAARAAGANPWLGTARTA